MNRDVSSLLNCDSDDLRRVIHEFGTAPNYEVAEPEDFDDSGYFLQRSLGFEATVRTDERVGIIYFHSAGHHGYEQYRGELPRGLDFSMSRSDVRSLIGAPAAEGGPVTDILTDKEIHWDRWTFPEYQLHCQYPERQDSTDMVTITRIERAYQVGAGQPEKRCESIDLSDSNP